MHKLVHLASNRKTYEVIDFLQHRLSPQASEFIAQKDRPPTTLEVCEGYRMQWVVSMRHRKKSGGNMNQIEDGTAPSDYPGVNDNPTWHCQELDESQIQALQKQAAFRSSSTKFSVR